jgi:hypothetical protein
MGNKTNCLRNQVLQKQDRQEVYGEHLQSIPEWKYNKPDKFIQQSRPIQENQTSGHILKSLDSEAHRDARNLTLSAEKDKRKRDILAIAT